MLKTAFNDYADKRSTSLRSLRFTYRGKTLFLSSVANKTPDECRMRDLDIIEVHNLTAPQESSGSDATAPASSTNQETNKSSRKKNKSTSNAHKKAKDKKKQSNHSQESIQQEEPEIDLEECKAHHSKILSKLNEEVQPRLKEIRMRLNALDLERQPPKKKKKNKRKKKAKVGIADLQVKLPDSTGLGGKAGKPFYPIQVGEVQNLHRTTKPSNSSPSSTLDLHGCTREEALAKLDQSHKVWVDTAMRGSYPFVMSAVIVCGCGSQVLSETVQEWIKSTRSVCNAPKQNSPRSKF